MTSLPKGRMQGRMPSEVTENMEQVMMRFSSALAATTSKQRDVMEFTKDFGVPPWVDACDNQDDVHFPIGVPVKDAPKPKPTTMRCSTRRTAW